MYVKTTTGSIYEIDSEKMQARRVSGVKAATKNVKADGEWRSFREIETQPNGALLIIWGTSQTDTEIILHRTLTSPVVKESEDIGELTTVN